MVSAGFSDSSLYIIRGRVLKSTGEGIRERGWGLIIFFGGGGLIAQVPFVVRALTRSLNMVPVRGF